MNTTIDCLGLIFCRLSLKNQIALRKTKQFKPAAENCIKERFRATLSCRDFMWLKDRVTAMSKTDLVHTIQKQSNIYIINLLVLTQLVDRFCFFKPVCYGKYETTRNLFSFKNFIETRLNILRYKDAYLYKVKNLTVRHQANDELLKKISILFHQWQDYFGFRHMGPNISSCIGNTEEPSQIYLQAMARSCCIETFGAGLKLIDLFKQAESHTPALHEIGMRYLQENNRHSAKIYFETATEKNWAPSMVQLAKLISLKEPNRAFELMLTAGNTGYLQAYIELSELALREDEKQLWLKKAASLGSTVAQFKLGTMLLKAGKNAEGYPWILQAAKNGSVSAQYTHFKLITNPSKKKKWLLRSARGQHLHAQYDLGLWYEGQNRLDVALDWYRKSMSNGCGKARPKIEALTKGLNKKSSIQTPP